MATHGRGLARGFLFDRQGRLCVSLAQEGLTRLLKHEGRSAALKRRQRVPMGV